MKITITGISGFVGQNLNKYLIENGSTIFPLSLRDKAWKDQLERESQAIIHLAGKAHDTANTAADAEYFTINRDLTIQLFDQFLASEIRDFFYFSSVKAVADTVAGVLTEDTLPQPLTPYGKSKRQAEEYLLAQELPAGKRLFIIRPCMIHGPGNKGNLNLLYKIVEKGLPWPLASFDNERSFLSIDNLSFLVGQMLNKAEICSGVYNFADDEALSTNQLVSLLASRRGKKAKLWKIAPGLIRTLVKVGDLIPLPINSERLKKLTESYVVSNAKIKQALALQKLPLSVTEGLAITMASFRDN